MKKILLLTVMIISCWNLAALPMMSDELPSTKKQQPDARITYSDSKESAVEDARGSLERIAIKDNLSQDNSLSAVNVLTKATAYSADEVENSKLTQEEEPVIKNFRIFLNNVTFNIDEEQFSFNSEQQQNLHACLKALQKCSDVINYNSSQLVIKWDNDQQLFINKVPQKATKEAVIFDDISEEILQTLNDYVSYERIQRRADSYPIEYQDQSEPKLLNELLSHELNPDRHPLIIVYNNKESRSAPILLPDAISTSLSSSSSHSNNSPILLFGFNVPGKSGPRLKIQDTLKRHFTSMNIQSMNDYNKSLGLTAGGIKFEDYLTFIKEAKEQTLDGRVNEESIETLNQDGVFITVLLAKAWATFLSKTDNLSRFDFSRKLVIPENRTYFISKNYKHITTNRGISPELKRAFNDNNWPLILEYVDPALNLLAAAGNLLINKETEDNRETVMASLKQEYDFLEQGFTQSRKKDLQLVLNSILSEAFFRTTSKLGLKFAREQNIKVAFVWNHAFSSIPPTLAEVHNYFERKPYYCANFRTITDNKGFLVKYPEAITCSEMRHLGRLIFLMLNQVPDVFSPNFLLIRDIILLETSLKAASAAASEEI